MDTPDTPERPQAPGTADGPLLDLTTLITRPTIRIDEEIFEILSPDEVSIIDSHRFGLWGRRIQALADIEGDDAEKELTELVSKVARKVTVGVPDEVFAKLPGAHRQAISDVFTGLLLRNRLGVAGAIAKAAGLGAAGLGTTQSSERLPTGERPSPVSSVSLADSRSGGWLKRLRRWFGRS
jgi:hypothetical protein